MNLERQLAAHYAEVRARCYGRPVHINLYEPPPPPLPCQPKRRRRPVHKTWRTIAEEVAAQHGVHIDLIFSPLKGRKVVACRREIWARVRNEIVMADGHQPSYPQMARWFKRDPSSIIHSVAVYEREHGKAEPAGKPNAGYVAR